LRILNLLKTSVSCSARWRRGNCFFRVFSAAFSRAWQDTTRY
jgi:hypothetical protein